MRFFFLGPEDLEQGPDRSRTLDRILELAAQAEKDSILFYHTLARHVKNDDLARQLMDLVEFEFDHLRSIGVLRNLVRKAAQEGKG